MNFKAVEEKWVRKWEEAKLFEADPIEGKPKIFVTFPFPYMNGPLHIGHAFTSTRCDVYARFKRMQGCNVLFPWAWHITGEPITGAAERIKKGDAEQLRIFREIDEVSEEELKKFTDPKYIASYYIKESKASLKELCHSIDWRREFTTTSLHPHFSRFIEWQYLTLRKKGYVRKGTHPVVWCQNCESPTGDHDRLRGEGASPVEFVLLKFKFDDVFLPAATLRPETIFGVTNMWLNPEAEYVKVKVGKESWIISREAANKLKEQKEISVVGTIKGAQLVGKHCEHPITKQKVLILPAPFVNPDNASGVVMSVPSHAPYDWIALKDLFDAPSETEKYGISAQALREVKPVSLIKTNSFGEHPAIEICERMGIKNQSDPKVEEATEIIYKEEFYKGVLKENTGKYRGMRVAEVKKVLISDFEKEGIADRMYELSEEVVCRCANKCVVKILKDQWFLNFSDETWKSATREALGQMRILPEEARANFEYTIDWLEAKACARKTGLGTPLPWDKEWKVETLSDSTVYMAFYTIAKHINKYKIPAESLSEEVFDFIFYGNGDAAELGRKNKIDRELLEEMRREFKYWMPVDLRNSAKELIPNHLTFFIFHHVALFPKEHWPRRIAVNGMISIEGEKMSKSKGNFITVKNALRSYGASVTRASLLYSSESLRDPDWRAKAALDVQKQLIAFYNMAMQIIDMRDYRKEKRSIDAWLIGKLQRNIKRATEEYEEMRTRSAFQAAFFDIWKDVRWYMRRDKPNREVLLQVLETWVKLLSPYIPALCEELWSRMNKKGFVSTAAWPSADESLISKEAELGEELIERTTEDIDNILEVTKIKPKRIILYTSPHWKWEVLKILSKMEKPDIKEVMKNEELRKRGSEVVKYVNEIMKEKISFEAEIDELKTLKDASEFFEKEVKCSIEVFSAEEEAYDPLNKRKQAAPMKPAIYVE